MRQLIRRFLKQVTPPGLVVLGRAVSRRKRKLSPVEFANEEALVALRRAYEKRNLKRGEGEIAFRDDLIFQTHPESKEAMEHFCYRSPGMVMEMDCFIERTKDKKRLLDIGALHGVFSLAFAMGAPSRMVVAVDASPIAFSRLLYNTHKNNLNNITAIECALSDEAGTLRMHYEWEHAVAAKSGQSDQVHLSVAKRTGDELCEQLSFEPDVVKIDVEGHEVKVVKGMTRLLARKRPLVFLELHPARILQEQDRIEDLTRILDVNDYSAFLIDGTAIQMREIADFTEDQRIYLTPR